MRYELHHLASYHQKANIEEYKERLIYQTNKKKSICHTYRNKSEVCYPFLYVPDDFIPSPLQKHSRTRPHPAKEKKNELVPQ